MIFPVLQASDDSMKGGLMTAVATLKQLLVGAILWNPAIFHHVNAHHLVNGDLVNADPDHAEATMSGVCLDEQQNQVLLIVSGEVLPWAR